MDQLPNNNSLEPKEWLKRYSAYLLRYAQYRVTDKELAEDLVQDTFLSALKAISTYQGNASEKTWLTAILKNKILDHFKKASTQKETSLIKYSAPNYEHFFNSKKMGHWQGDAAPMEWNKSESKVEGNEFRSILEKCLEALPAKWKSLFSMSVLEEDTTDRICKEFNITSSNFWVIMHRSKLQLRECLEKKWIKI